MHIINIEDLILILMGMRRSETESSLYFESAKEVLSEKRLLKQLKS